MFTEQPPGIEQGSYAHVNYITTMKAKVKCKINKKQNFFICVDLIILFYIILYHLKMDFQVTLIKKMKEIFTEKVRIGTDLLFIYIRVVFHNFVDIFYKADAVINHL